VNYYPECFNDQTTSGKIMLQSMLMSMLPDGFNLDEFIQQAQQFMQHTRDIAETVKRTEQKIDAEIAVLRDRVNALESVHQTNGDSNDDSNGATGKPD
jgi:hypothetical protein